VNALAATAAGHEAWLSVEKMAFPMHCALETLAVLMNVAT
jgi:hypothetical protein